MSRSLVNQLILSLNTVVLNLVFFLTCRFSKYPDIPSWHIPGYKKLWARNALSEGANRYEWAQAQLTELLGELENCTLCQPSKHDFPHHSGTEPQGSALPWLMPMNWVPPAHPFFLPYSDSNQNIMWVYLIFQIKITWNFSHNIQE